MRRLVFVCAIVTVLSAGVATSQDSASRGVKQIELPKITVQLKEGDGRGKTEAYCGICHSLDYITMQPKVSKAQWTATVNKMINVMAAPIPKSDAQIIIEYLAEWYGTGK
jgi:cytochrome c5